MIITVQVSLPMTDAQGVKESVAMRLEDMGAVAKVLDVKDDGFGEQMAIGESRKNDTEEAFPEAMAMYRRLKARREGRC